MKRKKKLINPFLHLYISYYYSILNILGKVGLSEVPEGDIRKNVNNIKHSYNHNNDADKTEIHLYKMKLIYYFFFLWYILYHIDT